jgi:hypothetical protein
MFKEMTNSIIDFFTIGSDAKHRISATIVGFFGGTYTFTVLVKEWFLSLGQACLTTLILAVVSFVGTKLAAKLWKYIFKKKD